MHIAIVVPSLSGGGDEKVMLLLAEGLASRGNRVTVVVEKRLDNDYEVPRNCEVVALESTSSRATIRSLAKFMASTEPDVIYTGLPHLNFIAVLSRSLVPRVHTSIVVSVHNNLLAEFPELPRGWLWRRLTRVTYRAADRVVCVSEGVRKQTIAVFHSAREKTFTIHNGLQTLHCGNLYEVNAIADASLFRVVSAGRLVPQKDYPTALRAMAYLNSWGVPIQLQVLGDGPDRHMLEVLVKQLDLTHQVEFVGRVQDVRRYLLAADVYLQTSKYEGFGLAIAEALSVGRAVVSTDAPFGPAELLGNGQYGVLTPVGDALAVANALRDLYVQPNTRIRLAHRAVERSQVFSLTRSVEEHELLFHDCISGRVQS